MADTAGTNEARQGQRQGWLARHGSKLGLFGFLVVLAGVLTMAYAALGYRGGWVDLRLSLQTLLPAGAVIAGVGAALCLILTIVFLARSRSQGFGRGGTLSAAGLLIGAVAFYVPFSMMQGARGAPPIHDITTDLADPPQFVDAVPLRKATGARNPVEYKREGGYGGNKVIVPVAQQEAFPDIQPVMLEGVAPDQAFKRALAAVDEMGWELIASRPQEGRIEAWDQTLFFGFIDDVSIRVRPAANGSQIDVRSLSRIGGGDAGTNAKRVRAYIAALKSQ